MSESLLLTNSKNVWKDTLGWGFFLWLFGYIVGILLFMVVPPAFLGWVIMPLGILVTLWVLMKKIQNNSFQYFFTLAVTWTIIAIVCDYFFLVKVFNPADGYYKLDVYVYYILTFILPFTVGLWRQTRSR